LPGSLLDHLRDVLLPRPPFKIQPPRDQETRLRHSGAALIESDDVAVRSESRE
jgi:hypothetical protein